MKILVVRSSNPFAHSNASNNRFLSLAEGLAGRNCQTDLLIIGGYYGKNEKVTFGYAGVQKGIYYQYLIKADYSNFFIRQFYLRLVPDLFFNQKMKFIVGKKEYDYIWMDVGKRATKLGLYLKKENQNQKLFQERSEFSWIGFSGNKRTHKCYLYHFLPNLDAMAVMTRTLSNYYKQYVGYSTKIIHLPMTVDLARFVNMNEINSLNKPYIAYCGAMSNKKDGVDILIQAFIAIKDDFPNIHLYLAGPLHPKENYLQQKEIIKQANCNDRVSYLGEMSRDKIPSFLFNASVLALARPESKQAEGGFPTKLGEYLATGKPVCVTKVGEIGDYLKHEESAYIAEPGSVDSFANALRKAITDNRRTIVGKNGKRVAYRYFNKDVQAELLYRFLLENK